MKIRRYTRQSTLIILFVGLWACDPVSEHHDEEASDIYRLLTPEESGINYVNKLTENDDVNYLFYPDLYGGGGVAVGDINNDGLTDIYISSILSTNALYLNKGNLKFENISESGGTFGRGKWTKGVTMADVNSDGYLDIYVSVGGPLPDRKNLLFINNKDNTFTESAESYGIADEGYSVQSAFFDYDRDGDLDLFIATNPPAPFQSRNSFYDDKRRNPDPLETDRLYRNDNGSFTDVTKESGILNYGLSLGLSVSDFNKDGWLDIYVSNDFNSPDYMYINNGDGSFTNSVREYLAHTAQFGMGTDAADINNDGLVDMVQLDMSYTSNLKKKTNMPTMWPEQFYEMVDLGLHHQYMRNSLQLNTGLNSFSDIAQIAGMGSTDWSWGALFFDTNNDGLKDLFITNGMRRDVNDNDFLNEVKDLDNRGQMDPARSMEIINKMPVNPVDNFLFLNNDGLTFSHTEGNLGLSFEGFSHGTAYADFDNDGDLDVVVNNLDNVSQVYENKSNEKVNTNHLRIKLLNTESNSFAIGAKVEIYYGTSKQFQELVPTRGYLSSVEPILHFGMGSEATIDSAQITWPDGSIQTMKNLAINELLTIEKSNVRPPSSEQLVPTIFAEVKKDLTPPYNHVENKFNDFDREVLLPHKMSQFGPALAVADVNGDNLEDMYVGGAMGLPGTLYLQDNNGSFISSPSVTWENDKEFEDVSAIFFDVNGDGSPDLYIASGGNEISGEDPHYQDRLYINDTKGGFIRNHQALPEDFISSSRISVADFDNDGDFDLAVGGRQDPGSYPRPVSSRILRNDTQDGQIVFTDITSSQAEGLEEIGMVTDLVWMDYNNDSWIDLVVVGEWMGVRLFENQESTFVDITEQAGFSGLTGWWFSVEASDLDNDGDMDLIAGNLGKNYKYKANSAEPFEIYSSDFDDNGSLDIVLAYYSQDKLFPLRGRTCSSEQVPQIKEKYENYFDFGNATLEDVYGENRLSSALHYTAETFASSIFINDNGVFRKIELELMAQLSSVNIIEVIDYNNDSKPDLLLGGNLLESEVETPRSDAGYGVLLEGDGSGNFSYVPQVKSGLNIKGEIRESSVIKMADGSSKIILAINEEPLTFIELK